MKVTGMRLKSDFLAEVVALWSMGNELVPSPLQFAVPFNWLYHRLSACTWSKSTSFSEWIILRKGRQTWYTYLNYFIPSTSVYTLHIMIYFVGLTYQYLMCVILFVLWLIMSRRLVNVITLILKRLN